MSQFSNYIKPSYLKNLFNTKQKEKANMGTDGIVTPKFIEILDDEIDIINRKVSNQTYKFSPYKEKLILKNKSSLPRAISIPTNRDRLTLGVLTNYLNDSYNDILIRSDASNKISQIKQHLDNDDFDSFIKLDIENFYPSIDHEILLKRVRKVIKDEVVLSLLEKAIHKESGIPQGLSISPILSSIYFHNIDKKYSQKENLAYFRFVDDIVIFCKKEDMSKVKANIRRDMRNLKLSIHPFGVNKQKSAIGDIQKDSFDFLGYCFDGDKISIRESSQRNIKEALLNVFYENKEDNYQLYRKLNLRITGCIYDDKQYGWLYYFRYINDMTLLYGLDSFIQNCFKRFKLVPKENKLKFFVKTYYALKSKDTKKYIPQFTSKNEKEIKRLINKFEKEVKIY
jgi:retron-type reverse transcriptase